MSAEGFLRLLKDADLVPHVLSVDGVEEILARVVPPSGIKET